MISNPFHSPKPFLYPGEEIRPHRQYIKEKHLLPEGSVKRAVETGRTRALITGSLFVLAFLSISIRLIDLMVLKAEDIPTANHHASSPQFTVERADIVDRNGVLLATNLPTVNLYADSLKIVDANEAADKLISVLPSLNRTELLAKLKSGKRFIYLSRNLTPREQAAVNAKGIPGVYFQNSERRVYLQGSLMSHALGATDLDNNGVAGIERAFNDTLKNDKTPLRLSLDSRIQYATREALARNIEHFQAKDGAAIVMDVHSGEVLSMVSLPDFDPEYFGSADDNARFNRVTLGVYEMGSVFKLFNTAMALDSGKVRLTDTFNTVEPLRVAQFTINDVSRAKKPLSVQDILVKSSNIGSALIAEKLGTDYQKAFLDTLGMLQPVSLEFRELGSPLVPTPWRDINTITIAYGHGIAVTGMHVASAVSALVNGGEFRQPTLLAGTQNPSTRVIRPETSAIMRKLMRMIVTDGTAKKADVIGYMVGAKTGTAEKAIGRNYSKKKNLTVSTAIFPADNPRYLVFAMLDEPQPLKSTFGFTTAGWNAAPTAADIITGIAPILGVQPRPPDAIPSGFPLPEEDDTLPDIHIPGSDQIAALPQPVNMQENH